MSKSPWWANSPVVILPLCAFAFGLAIVPFGVASTDHAAQFYGSLTAAVIAAGAVVGNAYLQSKLEREQKLADRRHDMLAETVELYAWMDSLGWHFYLLGALLAREAKTSNKVTVGKLREKLPRDVRERLRNRLAIAARIPQPIGAEVVDTLHKVDSSLEAIILMSAVDPDTQVSAKVLKAKSDWAEYCSKLVRWRRARLGEFLLKESSILSLDGKDRDALAGGKPKTPSDIAKEKSSSTKPPEVEEYEIG